MRPRTAVASAVLGVPAVLAVLADPLGRGVTLAQAALLTLAALTLALPPARRHCVPGPIMWLPAALVVVFLLSTTAAFVLGREVDVIQAVRDLRDLAIFTVGVVGLQRWATAFEVPVWRVLVTGLGGVLVVELVLRDRGAYHFLFLEPFGRFRYRAGLLGPNEYGAVASIALAMAVGAWVERRSAAGRAGLLACIGAAVLVSLSTVSRGAAAGAAIATAVVMLAALADSLRRGGGQRWRRRGAVAAVLVSGVVAVAMAPGRLNLLWTALRMRVDQTALGTDAGDRAALALAAVEIGADAPVIGRGLGSFAALNAARGGSGTLSPHNELLKGFAEGGVVAMAIVAAWFGALGLVAWRRRGEPGGYAMLGGVIAFVLAEQLFTYLVRPGLSAIAATLVAGLAAPNAGARQ